MKQRLFQIHRCRGLQRRRGMTLLETTMAFSLAAMLLTPVLGLLHTSRQVWEVTDSDASRVQTLHATLRNVSEQLRSAKVITAVETLPGKSARLSFVNSSGQVRGWLHDSRLKQVVFLQPGSTDLLAEGIEEVQFETYSAAGVPTVHPPDVRQIRCRMTVQLQGKNNERRTAECWTWLRG